MPGARVLDIGAGNCLLCQTLARRGYEVTPVDLDDHSFVDEIAPVIYDGETVPFSDSSFDVALLITVLHHAREPDTVLAEARRVATTTIVIEEIYNGTISKWATYAIDSLFNLEFFGHPRSNRTDEGWKTAFERLGFRVRDAKYSKSLLVLNRVTYVLDRKRAAGLGESQRVGATE